MIDFHTHIFPEKIAKATLAFLSDKCKISPYTNGIAAGLSESTQAAGLDISVVLPVVTNPSQFTSINEFAAGLSQENLLSFGGIHPDASNYKEELHILKKYGFKGIKLHPDYQGTFINDIRYEHIIDHACELGLIVSIHSGFDPGYPECIHCPPDLAAQMLDDVQPENIVLAHMGGLKQWDMVEDLLVGRDVYFDTAVVFGQIADDQFLRICRNHGADKILFATDSPWSGQKKSIDYLKAMNLTEKEKDQIFDGNARKLLTL